MCVNMDYQHTLIVSRSIHALKGTQGRKEQNCSYNAQSMMNVTPEKRRSSAMKNTNLPSPKQILVFFRKVSLNFSQLWMCNSCKIK